jgi:hypothetical protein
VAHWRHVTIKEAAMTTNPDPAAAFPQVDRIDLDELFRDAPVLKTPHDLAAPEIFPDDAEFEEFLASVRADRARDLA